MVLPGLFASMIAACHPHSGSASLPAADRDRLYAAVLRDVSRDSAVAWVVVDSLRPANDIEAELQDKVMAELPISREALDAFLAAQRMPVAQVHAAMLPDARWALVSNARLEALREAARAEAADGVGRTAGQAGGFWTQWQRAFPGSGGYVVLSPASIWRDGATAVVLLRTACGAVCGETELRLLRRAANGEWRTTGRVRLSES